MWFSVLCVRLLTFQTRFRCLRLYDDNVNTVLALNLRNLFRSLCFCIVLLCFGFISSFFFFFLSNNSVHCVLCGWILFLASWFLCSFVKQVKLESSFFFFQIRYEVYFTLPFLTGANIFSSCNFCVSSNLLAFNLYGVLKTRQPLSNQPCEQAVSLKFYKRM